MPVIAYSLMKSQDHVKQYPEWLQMVYAVALGVLALVSIGGLIYIMIEAHKNK